MKTKNILLITFIVVVTFLLTGHQFLEAKQTKQEHSYTPKDGYVPNKETAIKIAEAIWLPIYGKVIESEKPYIAELKDSTVWIVQGTLKSTKGGVAYIEIQKSDCKILKVTHGK